MSARSIESIAAPTNVLQKGYSIENSKHAKITESIRLFKDTSCAVRQPLFRSSSSVCYHR